MLSKHNIKSELTNPEVTGDALSQIESHLLPRSVYKFYYLQMYGPFDSSLDPKNPRFNQTLEQISEFEKDEEVKIALEFDFELAEDL